MVGTGWVQAVICSLEWFRSTFQECPELRSLCQKVRRHLEEPWEVAGMSCTQISGGYIISWWVFQSRYVLGQTWEYLREEQGRIINIELSQIVFAIWSTKLNCFRKSLKLLLETSILAVCRNNSHPHAGNEAGYLKSKGFNLIFTTPSKVRIIIPISIGSNWVSKKEVPCHIAQLVSSQASSTSRSCCWYGQSVPIS